MDAVTASKAAKFAQARAERQRQRERKKAIVEAARRLAWAKKKILPQIRTEAAAAITAAAKAGNFMASYHYRGEEREMGEMAAQELREKGFAVRVECGKTESTHDGDSGWSPGGGYLYLHIQWPVKL
jgi:hypothetical protein